MVTSNMDRRQGGGLPKATRVTKMLRAEVVASGGTRLWLRKLSPSFHDTPRSHWASHRLPAPPHQSQPAFYEVGLTDGAGGSQPRADVVSTGGGDQQTFSPLVTSCQTPTSAGPRFLLCKMGYSRDFPGGPVVKTPRFQCRGRGFDPWWGN